MLVERTTPHSPPTSRVLGAPPFQGGELFAYFSYNTPPWKGGVDHKSEAIVRRGGMVKNTTPHSPPTSRVLGAPPILGGELFAYFSYNSPP